MSLLSRTEPLIHGPPHLLLPRDSPSLSIAQAEHQNKHQHKNPTELSFLLLLLSTQQHDLSPSVFMRYSSTYHLLCYSGTKPHLTVFLFLTPLPCTAARTLILNTPRTHPQLRTFQGVLSHSASDPTCSQWLGGPTPPALTLLLRLHPPALTWLALLPPPWLLGYTAGPIIWNVLLPESHIIPISIHLGLCFKGT